MSDLFLALVKRAKLPAPTPEFEFHPTRKWRFDYAWPTHHLALEVEGGAWTNGRHTRGGGFLADCEKYSEAAVMGWRIIRVPPSMLATLGTVDWVARALAA